ncbi:MAG TPA: alpha/beta fold hydrolase [Actinomycetota bacterium]|nr:alpha/beta fold hydrolase [Actinomycetota bacterium]
MATADLGDVGIGYSTFGDDAADPVVGIMGFSLDKRFWSTQVPAVTPTHRFVTFDNRGIGRSRGPLVSTIDEMANDTVRLMDHLQLDDAVLFGMSMGGTIAQRVALDHPDRVKALILAVTWARPIEYMRRQHDVTRKILQIAPEELLAASLLKMFTPRFFELGRETVDQLIKVIRAEGPPTAEAVAVLAAQLDAIDKFDVLGQLPAIDCPTLVIGGRLDMIVPAFGAEEIAGAIPGADLVMLETGHGCMVEEMESFNEAVSRFLRAV